MIRSRLAIVFFFASAAAATSVGCVTMQGTAQTRAANDLRCPEEQVVVANIGGSSYRATGCGQEATYNCGASTGSTFVCMREEQHAVGQPPQLTSAPASK